MQKLNSRTLILVGDFNAHSTMWGSNSTFGRGKIIENIISNEDIFLLNTGCSTHFNISSGTFSNIDLSLCDPKLGPSLTWCPLDSLFDNDHFPILISDNKLKLYNPVSKWRIA
ncbi:uncharacterized protein [Diabrotica undecimpunctata]|uniref:uncharacterized protein n=1 Tax=Diabrotica undecimpunctata TaxID=50387 RepID=UPI003B64252B